MFMWLIWNTGRRVPGTPKGKYIYRSVLRFCEGSHLFFTPFSNLVIREGYLVAALEDTDGEVKLAKFKISLPSH